MSKTKSQPRSRREPPYRLRRSPVHGTGMFATRVIRKGASIIEYIGERISHEEADRRHAKKAADDNHTFLFTIDSKTVVDGGVGGNSARFINHSCEPNCEVIIDDGRLLIEATQTIRPGDEIVYDYLITRASDDPPDVERIFACRCGAPTCRGTMLAPRKKPKARKKKATSKSRAARGPRKGGSRRARGRASKGGAKRESAAAPPAAGSRLPSKTTGGASRSQRST
ncbi:MAG: SET domain-containing protein-lysine N-methyltransferase [Labilithrix sp.]|nr:SET domain-containing protein-lysine N-methyltransferase [Labilithrix sp.]